MQADERAAWLRLSLTPGFPPAAVRALLGAFGLPQQAFAASHAAVAGVIGEVLARVLRDTPARSEAAETWLDGGPGRFLVTLADPDYPRGLMDLADAPAVLYGHGRREALAPAALAIVGSRNATRQGEENAQAFAAHLALAGLCIVSGMARGIDAAAHRGALASDAPTIAYLGTGIDIVYPAAHRALAADIAAHGLLLSELPLGTVPATHQFPRRNRLIAAHARGVLVVEAAVQSGSLITARLATELGREVFAVPGSIHSPLARGCHRLLRDGAKLVESAQDVLEELRVPSAFAAPRASARAPSVPDADASSLPDSSPAASADDADASPAVLRALGFDPVDADTLAARAALAPGALWDALLRLELEGRIERLPGNRFQRLRA